MGRRRQQSKRERERRAQRPKPRKKPQVFSYCKCGKIIFEDQVSADMALTRGAGRKGSIRSYDCDVVPGNWHTTSKSLRKEQ